MNIFRHCKIIWKKEELKEKNLQLYLDAIFFNEVGGITF